MDPTDTLVPESSYWMCQDDGKCGTCAVSVLHAKGNMSMTYGDFVSEYISQGCTSIEKKIGKKFGLNTFLSFGLKFCTII